MPARHHSLPNAGPIALHVEELVQLFNPIDPAPLLERDLDPRVEEFIVDWSRELPAQAPLALLVRVDRPSGSPSEETMVRQAIHRYFAQRATAARRRLTRLFHTGRISLVIGVAALTAFASAAQFVARWVGGGAGEVLRESLLIGGWVAMWRPLEIFLYDWWPIRADARLFDRLAAMPVRVATHQAGPSLEGHPDVAPAVRR
jgi:hypothetical protein